MWTAEIKHDGLGKYRVIRGHDKNIVEQKAQAQKMTWEQMWERRLEKDRKTKERQTRFLTKHSSIEEAKERSTEALEAIAGVESILRKALDDSNKDIWESIKDRSHFQEPRPEITSTPNIPDMPRITDSKYNTGLTFLDKIMTSRRQSKIEMAQRLYEADYINWKNKKTDILSQIEIAEKQLEADVASWERRKEEYAKKRKEANDSINKRKQDYQQHISEAVYDFVELVLSKSNYPDFFPDDFDIDYNAANKILIIDRSLPIIDTLPNIKEVKYVQSKDEFVEAKYPGNFINKLYDDAIYQIVLRSIYEVFTNDGAEAIDAITFNGWVETIDKATGKEFKACILSIHVNKQEFMSINLMNVDPKTCFKGLKGVGSSKLYTLTPIAPLMTITREDKRFIASHNVAESLDETVNLAIMDWEEFEHLIRELFGKEFATNGGEVKITRASRDSGVDAVAFDPDPIRGGKIVIQAKRYTNTVGVSAVRDLYGTVMNEGATKGILVTTTDYGPDSYEFARGKPLTLLNGNNLLFLLEKHGHRAMIDIKAAKNSQGTSY